MAVAATAAMVVLGGDAVRWRWQWWWWLLRRDDKDGGGATAGGMVGDGVTGWRSGGDRVIIGTGFDKSSEVGFVITYWLKLYKLRPLQDPTTATIMTITIINGDGMPGVRNISRNNIPRMKFNKWEKLEEEFMR
ncbi:hypothetical protein Tco_1109088 [Tanacetum coccineum]